MPRIRVAEMRIVDKDFHKKKKEREELIARARELAKKKK